MSKFAWADALAELGFDESANAIGAIPRSHQHRCKMGSDMSRLVLFVLALIACWDVSASIPLDASLSDLACGADHLLVGRVVGVDMVNAKGKLVRNEKAMTGPGLTNTIRLHIETIEIIESPSSSLPKVLKVPLDPFMHYSLGQVRGAHAEPSEPMLVFLRGEKYLPVISGRFLWSLDARAEMLAVRKACKP